MTWHEQHARTEILHEVLARAAVDPTAPELLAGLPGSDRLFGGPAGILAALRYRWDNHLRAKLDQAQIQGQSAADAYRELAAQQPELHAILAAHEAGHWQREPVLAR